MTPLNRAAYGGHEAVVQLLLDSKAAIDIGDNVRGVVCESSISCWIKGLDAWMN